MNDDTDSTDDERREELSSIASIFPELVTDPDDSYTATLELPVTPIEPLRIFFKPAADGALLTPPTSTEQDHDDLGVKPQVQKGLQLDSHDLSHLPPLTLRINIPGGYPATQPPTVSVSVSPPWLSQPVLKRLSEDCARLWEEVGKDLVLYTYIVQLQEEADSAFGLAGTDLQLSSDLKLALLDFDLKTKREHFDKGTFDCGICLEPKKGINCHRLTLCGHVFCVTCLQDFYKSCITEGDVNNVKCLSPTCGKKKPTKPEENGRPSKRQKQDRTLNPSELLQIPIDQELVQRYVRLKRKKRLEADKNTIYCPRQWCQGAARTKKHPKPIDPMNDTFEDSSESEGEQPRPDDLESLPMAERLCVCEDCSFAFCCVCRKGWHGELARCSPRRLQELTEEESASAAYLEKYSTPCPTCDARAQKTLGCNHMICFNCKTHFCYLCSSYLMADNPYSHFNDEKSQCYMRLWVLEAGDGEGVDIDAHFRAIWGEHGEGVEPEVDDDDFEPEILEFIEEDGDDTSDEEPAPDVRRNREMHIEIVNFGRPGAQNPQRFMLPERPQAVAAPPPPAAPNPPLPRHGRRGHGQQGNRQRAMQNEPARANREARNQPLAQPVAREMNPDAGDNEPEPLPGMLPLAAPGQGNNLGFAQGLERFLRLAQDDQEDEWDSDELDDDGGRFNGPDYLEPLPRRRGREWA
ncbi:uncharacterized protein A1O9_01860 [Exophiala aquamarina CBS 119918]|uniref:RBR-type E3 ubiquitin transferase n=1 Tax=Exophiala aquamarina CBS 119918 TaxID=1182545 RepID=A0A072PVY0_9EURO|nr:uncharacterized protein A1O9_01860 [Exophiala aquamarina CBS 119918]KEF63882.1 hypothetical protein A1O9_01860 [Exophiala aquamarina CBS 119918]